MTAVAVDATVPSWTTAAVWRGDRRVALEALEIPALRPGGLLVRVDLATVCGSDRHTVAGHRSSPCPSVLGHEAVGHVVAGSAFSVDGATVSPGDRVVWGVTVPCAVCDRCARGLSAKCRQVRKVGHESLHDGWALSGGYAEHVVLPAGALLAHAPAGLVDAVVAPSGCATATVMAVLERAAALGSFEGRRVAVVGAGMLGLTAVAGAVSRGADEVIAVDPSQERRSLATRFGASEVAPSWDETDEVDVVLELSGSTSAAQAALDRLAVGGVAVLAGSVSPGPALTFDPETVVRRHLTVTGVHNYEPCHLVEALNFLARTSTERPWASLVSEPIRLDALPEELVAPPTGAPRASVAP